MVSAEDDHVDRTGDDYLSEVVPAEGRRHALQVLMVWLGFIIVVGIMAVGGGLAGQMTLRNAVVAIVGGNIILAIFAAFSGYLGAQSGKTFNQLTSEVFPGVSWRIVSLYVPIVLIGWFGVEAAIFGNLVGEILGWPTYGRRALMSAATLAFAVTSYLGFRAMRYVSTALVPIIVAIGLYAIYRVSVDAEAKFGFSATQIGLDQAFAIVIGTWIMGTLTCVPDLTRFCRSPVSGSLVASLGILFANTFTLLVGVAGAGLAGEHDPAKILVAFGFVPLAVVLSLANIWTTNDNNMYSAALNVPRMCQVSRKQAVVVCTILAAIFAAFDPTRIHFLFAFLGFMGSTAPALGGVVLGAYCTRRALGAEYQSTLGAWLGWLIGSAITYWIGGPLAVFLGFFGGWLIWFMMARLMKRPTGDVGD